MTTQHRSPARRRASALKPGRVPVRYAGLDKMRAIVAQHQRVGSLEALAKTCVRVCVEAGVIPVP